MFFDGMQRNCMLWKNVEGVKKSIADIGIDKIQTF